MLTLGTIAPDFTLPDHTGRPITLSSLRGRHVVLFFYPAADTRVCTLEACAFRDAFAALEGLDAVVLGISGDGREAQHAFASRWGLPFSLLCDTEGRVQRAYEVRTLFGLAPGRVTYVIDRAGVVRAAHRGMLEAEGHVRAALEALGGQRTG